MAHTKKDIYNYIQGNQVLQTVEKASGNIICFSDSLLSAEVGSLERESYNLLVDVRGNIDSGDIDLDYKILASALQYLEDYGISYEDFTKDDYHEVNFPFDGFSSVYTYDRLEYLNIHNQHDITQVIKEEIAEDIQQACALWYDNKVSDTIQLLLTAFRD